jgi:hypothetical protein
MTFTDVMEANQSHVTDLREDLSRVRSALDRTDAVLGVANETLERAEIAIKSGRRWGPVVFAVLGAAVLGAGVVIVMSRRRHAESELD